MKLASVLDYMNSFEKNPFLRVIDNIISSKPNNFKQVDKILSQLDGQLKNADNQSTSDILNLVQEEYVALIKEEFTNTTSHLDIVIDIIIRDGNSLMKREWLLKLYEKQIKGIKSKLVNFKELLDSEKDDSRLKYYRIYKECLVTAYTNDAKNNQDNKITKDEQSILTTLSEGLELSHEEMKLINYSVVALKKIDINDIIKYLSKIGVVFYSRKNHQVYIPDEIVRLLRKVRGKEVPDKIFRRMLQQLKDSHINLLSRKHNIDRKLPRDEKIKEIINEGIGFRTALLNGIHKEGTKKSEKRTFLNELIEKKLKITERIKGTSLEAKLDNLILYFESKEKDGNISISMGGYQKLLIDLEGSGLETNKLIRTEFELQENTGIDAKNLLKYNIKLIDLLDIIPSDKLKYFCEKQNVSVRGSEVLNVLVD